MNIVLTVQLPDELYESLLQMANTAHLTPEQWIVTNLSRQLINPIRDPKLRRHFGAINLGTPIGVDNRKIDEELAQAYAATHEAA